MRRILATTAVVLAMPFAGLAQTADAPLDREAVKQIVTETLRANPSLVLDAITANPEVVMEAITLLREREAQAEQLAAASALDTLGPQLFADANAPVVGNPDGTLAIVEFFDYNCAFCKRAMPVVQKAIAQNSELKVIYREWPILSEGSVFAARASLAARKQDKYEEFHWNMMGLKGQANETSVMAVARKIGLDLDRLRKDMESEEVESHIAQSMAMAQALDINGTPSFVIGDQLVPGFIEFEQMQKFLDEAQEKG